MGGSFLEVNSKGLASNQQMHFYHFVDLDLAVTFIFEKEGAREKGGVNFKMGD